MPPEGNQVGISVLYDFLSRSGFKASGCDDCSFEYLSESCRCNRILPLNAIESSGFGVLGRFAIIFDNARNFCDVERAVRRKLTPTMGRRLQYRWILPIFRVD